jgi:hypothetical protein
MKKIILLILILILAGNLAAYALETTLLDLRNEIFKNAQEIKTSFDISKDPILINSMWDSCVMSVSQLDAYFSMLGIFNTIKKENFNDAQFTYLINWLSQIKKTNELNIKSLDSVTATSEPKSKIFILKLKDSFNKLNDSIAKETRGVLQLQVSAKIKINRK